jgi:hypothetical protein
VAVEGELFPLAAGAAPARLIQTSAPAEKAHPVFSQQEPVEFIWCIAGERFRVGDKNRDIMTGTAQAITTSLVQSPKSKVQGHSLDLAPWTLDLGPWTFHGTSFHPDQRNRP